MKKLLCILLMLLISSVCVSCGSESANNDPLPVIEDAEQFSRISTDELKQLMGDPVSEDSWTNKTSKGDFEVVTLSYDKNSNRYEFIIADDAVVRLSIYSDSYWNGTGDRFTFNNDKSKICESFGISLGDNVKKVTDNNVTYALSPVNDKIAMFDVQDIDENTYGFVKITYNLNYFD